MKDRDWSCLALAVVAGAFAAFVDMHSSEVQPTVLTLFVTGILLGFAQPRLFWLSGVVAGATIPLSYLGASLLRLSLAQWPEPNVLASALAIVPAFIGTSLGAVLGGWTAKPATEPPPRPASSRDD